MRPERLVATGSKMSKLHCRERKETRVYTPVIDYCFGAVCLFLAGKEGPWDSRGITDRR